ncbi:hypothetical protein BGX23_012001 [Mortierella sp. AD031]|nr:hypothetical protein BGX23_012001 [Mortierella sp. AD031]
MTLAVITLASTISANPIPSAPQKRTLFGRYDDFSCKPSTSNPNPTILLHGLGRNSGEWAYMGTRFALKGYCAFSLDYGHIPGIPILGGLNDLMVSAQELSAFVDKVLAHTGASKVDLVGHSEGSFLPRVYLKYFGGRAKTDHFAGIGSNQYGTTLAGGALNPVCKACFQLTVGAPFIDQVAEGGDTFPDIKYHMLVSKFDQLVTPYTNGFLRTLGPNVRNVVLQDLCPLDPSEHLVQVNDPLAFNAIEYFLRTDSVTTAGCLGLIQ